MYDFSVDSEQKIQKRMMLKKIENPSINFLLSNLLETIAIDSISYGYSIEQKKDDFGFKIEEGEYIFHVKKLGNFIKKKDLQTKLDNMISKIENQFDYEWKSLKLSNDIIVYLKQVKEYFESFEKMHSLSELENLIEERDFFIEKPRYDDIIVSSYYSQFKKIDDFVKHAENKELELVKNGVNVYIELIVSKIDRLILFFEHTEFVENYNNEILKAISKDSKKSELLKMISDDETQKVFENLRTKYNMLENIEYVSLSSRYHNLEKRLMRGVIANDEYGIERNKIMFSLIQIVSQLDNA